MIKFLLSKLFSKQELLEGNYGGGRGKKVLDVKKINAIKDAVRKKFDFSQSVFSSTVNQKCNQIRITNKEFFKFKGW